MSEYTVTVDEAMERLAVVEGYDAGNGPEPCVHTFVSGGFGLLGAHWSVEEARRNFEDYGVEESGDQAQAMNHGLVCITESEDGRRVPVFFETKAGHGA